MELEKKFFFWIAYGFELTVKISISCEFCYEQIIFIKFEFEELI